MSVESKVFDQLNKVELKSQKIELSLINDAKQLGQILKTLNTNIVKNGEKAMELLSVVEKDGQKALYVFKDSMALLEKIAQMYEDLGIPSDGSEEPDVKNLIKLTDDLLAYRKRYRF